MPDNEVLKSLFNEFNPKLKLARDYNEFATIMSDENNRKDFFNEFNSKLNLAKDYKQFDEVLGLKKKDDSQLVSTIGSEPLPIGLDRFRPQVPTEAPSVLNKQGMVGYEQEIAKPRPKENPILDFSAIKNSPKPRDAYYQDPTIAAREEKARLKQLQKNYEAGKLDRNTFTQDLDLVAASGIDMLGRMASTIPSGILDNAIQAFGNQPGGLVSMGIDAELLGKIAEKQLGLPEEYNPLSPNNALAETFRKKAELNQSLSRKGYSGGITDALKLGEYKDAAKLLAFGFTESLPILLGLAATRGSGMSSAGSLISTGLGTQATTYQDLKTENPEIAKNILFLNATLTGIGEAGSEVTGTNLLYNQARKLFVKGQKEQAKEIVTKGIKEYLDYAFQKSFVGSAVLGDMSGEVANQVWKNATDKWSGVRPDVDYLDGVGDAAIISAFTTSTIAAGAKSLAAIVNPKTKDKIDDTSLKISNLQKEADNPDMPDAARTVIVNEIGNLTESINEDLKKDNVQYNNLDDDQKTTVDNLSDKRDEIKSALNNAAVSDETKQVLQNQLNDIDLQIESILSTEPAPEDTEIVEPSQEQKLKDIQDGNVVTFTYSSESEVPDVLKDKISSVSETNGVKEIRVTLPKSEADYLLKPQEDAVQVETTGQVPVQPEAPVSEEVEQGKPEAEPKVVTEEGVKAEEVTPELRDVESTAKALEDINNKEQEELAKVRPILVPKLPEFPTPKDVEIVEEKQKLADEINAKREAIKQEFADKRKAVESLIPQEQTPAQKVEQLRAKEQAELKAAIPNADQYLTDGKVDRTKITDTKELKKFDKIYDKYDKLITPRLKEAKADAEVAKLYALLGTPDGEPRFRLSDEVEEPLTSDVESIEKEMNAMPEVELNFTEPEVSQKGLKVDPVSESNSLVKIAKKVGDALLKPIQFFNGIPMITGMSDILSAGKIKDSTGKPMDVEGGLLFNVLGKNKNAAWAGVDREGAKEQYDNAVKLYNSNKELFDRLWSEGRLPDGHVPMAIMRMGNEAVNSNEAVFRWVLPTIEGLPKQNRIDAMNVFTETLQSKSDAITNKLNEFGKGKLSKAVLKELGLLNSTLKFIKDNKITDLGQFFKEIVSDSNKRAKGNSGSTLSLPNKTFIYNLIFAPKRIKTASKPVVKALLSGTDNSKNKIFTSDFIYSSIGEPSMLKSRQGEVVSIVGIDVKNGGVIKVDHGNYGFGPKGKTIALIENPTHGINVFPEWKAKASRVFKRSDSNDPNKKGKYPSPENVATQTGGAFFGDSAMKGAKVFADVISDLNLLIGKLRYAFPSVSVSTTQEEFNNIINSPDVRTQVSDGKVILGLTKDGKIYLNPEMSSLQTPIHEFGHIWIDFLRSKASGPKGTAFLNKGLDLVRNTKEHKKAIEKYGDTEIALEEALVELMANKGATIISAAQRSNFLSWMNGVFKYIQQKFTTFDVTFKNKDKVSEIISKLTLDEFINIGLADLFSGKELSTKFAPELSESSFKARMSAITDINEIVKIGLDNGISIDSITKVLKDKNFNEKEISLAVYNAISKDIKLDESNVENAIELLDEIEDNKRKAERASSKRKADLEQKISEAETELDKIQEEAKIVKVINDNFDKIKKDLKEQGLLNVKC
jgi:hypothetical protein